MEKRRQTWEADPAAPSGGVKWGSSLGIPCQTPPSCPYMRHLRVLQGLEYEDSGQRGRLKELSG